MKGKMKQFETATTWRLCSAVVLLLLLLAPYSAKANAEAISLAEALDNASLTWATGGDADWFGQTSVYYHDGDAAQSGDVASGQSSWIETTVTGPGILSFYWKADWFTYLVFYVDGIEKTKCWSHEWEVKTYSIPSGNHTLRWVYAPSLGGYAGFLDKVVFTEGPVITVQSPNGGETWYHRNSSSIRWLSTEDVGPSVKLELYKGESLTHTIAYSTDNDGYYSWFVPVWLVPGADYRVKITSTSNSSSYDYGDGYFSISEWFQSFFGGLLVLDGVDDYAEAGDHPELDVGDDAGESLTVEGWLYVQRSGSLGDSLYIDKQESYELYARRYTTDRTYGCIGVFLVPPSGPTQGYEVCEWPPYSLGWHHAAAVFYQDTGHVRIYLDGEAFSDPHYFGPAFKNSAGGLKVGGKLGGGMDEVRISDVDRYTGTTYIIPTYPFTCDEHTRALWHFDELEGATVFHDACGMADNVLVGYNGAHTEGIPAHRVYLPLVARQY